MEEEEVVEEEDVLSAILSSSVCDKDTVPSLFNGCPCTSISSMGKTSSLDEDWELTLNPKRKSKCKSGGWGLNLWNGGRKERGRGEIINAAVPETKYKKNGTANPIDKPNIIKISFPLESPPGIWVMGLPIVEITGRCNLISHLEPHESTKK